MTIGGISLNTIITIFFAGIICASIYTYYTKKFLGGLLIRLSEKGADSKENAQSLKNLGYSGFSAFLIGLSLGENSSLRRYVDTRYSVDEAAVLKEEKAIPQSYYLSKEKEKTALERYDGKNMKLSKLLLGILACIIAAIICSTVFPYIVRMLKGTGENFTVENEVRGAHIEETVVSDTTAPESETEQTPKAEQTAE